jgi:dTDP-4-dehydrorhamnose reductase
VYGDKIKILVTGSEGQIGRAFCRIANKIDQIELVAVTHRNFDVTNLEQVTAKLASE